MPTYRTSGTLEIDGVRYRDGTDIVLNPGALCDQLLTGQAIYRPDIPPYQPRGLGDAVLLPVKRVVAPQEPKPPMGIFLPGKSTPSGFSPEEWTALGTAYATEPCEYRTLVDEWSVPGGDNWPYSVEAWKYFPMSMRPARGFRLIR